MAAMNVKHSREECIALVQNEGLIPLATLLKDLGKYFSMIEQENLEMAYALIRLLIDHPERYELAAQTFTGFCWWDEPITIPKIEAARKDVALQMLIKRASKKTPIRGK